MDPSTESELKRALRVGAKENLPDRVVDLHRKAKGRLDLLGGGRFSPRELVLLSLMAEPPGGEEKNGEVATVATYPQEANKRVRVRFNGEWRGGVVEGAGRRGTVRVRIDGDDANYRELSQEDVRTENE